MIINKKYLPALLLFLAGFAGCGKKVQKDVLDYYPRVGATTVSIQPDGSVKVTGNLTDAGSGELYFVGFCMDEAPHPEMHINQRLVHELNGSEFTATYTNLSAVKKYYVRSFAANENGYAYGDEAVIEHASMDTNSIPCHPAANTMTIETTSSTKTDDLPGYNIDKLDPIRHRFSIASANYSWHLDFEFNRTPTSGMYKIWGISGGNSETVSILFTDPNIGSYYMERGGYIYVQQLDADRIKVWMCHQKAGFDNYITTSFTTR